MDYKKKSLSKLNHKESYEEIDTRLASGWYVDAVDNKKKKNIKQKKFPLKFQKNINLEINNFKKIVNSNKNNKKSTV